MCQVFLSISCQSKFQNIQAIRGNFIFNIDDSHMEEADGLLKEYRRTKAVGMHIVSRKEIEAQYVAEPRSSAVIEYDVSVEAAPARDIKFH